MCQQEGFQEKRPQAQTVQVTAGSQRLGKYCSVNIDRIRACRDAGVRVGMERRLTSREGEHIYICMYIYIYLIFHRLSEKLD